MDANEAARRLINFGGVGYSLERDRLERADGRPLSPDAVWDYELGDWVEPDTQPDDPPHSREE